MIKIQSTGAPVPADIFTTQLQHLRPSVHFGRGGRKVVRVIYYESVSPRNVGEIYTHGVSAV